MRSIVKMSVLMGLALLLVEGSANAALVEIKVPFPFQVENQTLPAGQYRVERDIDNPSILFIRGENGIHASVIASSVEAGGQNPTGDKAALVFTHGETGYRLKDVWESHAYGRELPAS